jgi:hypothetical protein
LNGISAGDGLGVLLECCFFGGQTFVVFAGKIYRADRGALTTAGAFGKINITWVLTNPGFKIPRFAVKS